MDERDRRKLNTNMRELERDMDFDAVTTGLIAREIYEPRKIEILERELSSGRSKALLIDIQKRGPKACSALVDSLREARQEHLAEMLERQCTSEEIPNPAVNVENERPGTSTLSEDQMDTGPSNPQSMTGRNNMLTIREFKDQGDNYDPNRNTLSVKIVGERKMDYYSRYALVDSTGPIIAISFEEHRFLKVGNGVRIKLFQKWWGHAIIDESTKVFLTSEPSITEEQEKSGYKLLFPPTPPVTKICDVLKSKDEELYSIQGNIIQDEGVKERVVRGKKANVRNITFADETGEISVGFWRPLTQREELKIGNYLHVTHLYTNTYAGKITLGSTVNTQIQPKDLGPVQDVKLEAVESITEDAAQLEVTTPHGTTIMAFPLPDLMKFLHIKETDEETIASHLPQNATITLEDNRFVSFRDENTSAHGADFTSSPCST